MIHLGHDTDGKKVRIDVDHLVASRMLLQANSGGGKSWALRRLLEQTHGAVQQIVIDPEGEFFTLRESFDFVIAGRGGDCPAEPRSAELLARRLLELGVSAVIDIQEQKPRDRVRFVRLFLEALVNAPRSLWHPVLVVIDEAHTFAPQTGQAESLDAVADLMAKGRKRGFCGVLATQRISKLHKDVAAEANNLLIGRARLDVDRKRAADDLGFTSREQQMELQKLAAGEFFCFGPAFERADVTRIRVAEVVTSHPKAGAGAPPVAAPRARVKALLGELADLPAEAEEEARTVEQLRARIRELEAAAKRTGPAPINADALEKIRQEANDRAAAASMEAIAPVVENARAIGQAARAALLGLEWIREHAESLVGAPLSVRKVEVESPTSAPAARQPRPIPQLNLRAPRAQVDRPEGISGGCLRMLVALASRAPAGFTIAQWATLAKLKRTGGTWSTYLSRLRVAELVVESGGLWYATEEGIAAAGELPPMPETPAEVLAMWQSNLGGGPARMLEALSNAEPRGLSLDGLSEAVGITRTGGTFGTYLSRLRSNGLVESSGDGVRLSEILR